MNRHYIGSSGNVEQRLQEHNRGKAKFTKKGIPWKLVYVEEFSSKSEAAARERYIKQMKSRKYIESLIG